MINITNITNAVTFWDWTSAINETSIKVIGTMILISLFFIIFMGSLAFGKKTAFVTSGVITGMIGILFWATSFIPSTIGIIFIVLFMMSLLAFFMGDG